MDSTQLLDANRLLAFVTVAREGGFSRAARRLAKTQSSVSQAVAQLERELGTTLFLRQARAVRLTQAGALLLDHADRLFQGMVLARQDLDALGTLRGGRLTLGTSDTLAYHLLPPLLAAFRRRHPDVELTLENRPSPVTAARVAEGALDVGVVSGPLAPDARLQSTPLCPQREVLICPPHHPFARRRRIPLRALEGESLLLLDRSTGGRAFLDAALAEQSLRPRVSMEMGSVEVLKRLVELGFGLSVVPELAVIRERKARKLAVVVLEGLGAARRVELLLPARGSVTRAALAFAELAKGRWRGEGAAVAW